MYRGYLNRKKETQARAAGQQYHQQANTPAVPVSQATSLSSTANLPSSSLAAHAATTSPSVSSQSDTSSADHSVTTTLRAPSTSPKNRFFPVSISPGPRPTTPPSMGQTNSSLDSVPHSPASQSYPAPVSLSPPSSNPLKRIWGGRRKKSEDVTAVFAAAQDPSRKGKERANDVSAASSVLSTPASSVDDLQVQNDLVVDVGRSPSRAKRLLQLQISPKKHSQSPKAPKFSGSPPIPPPKDDESQTRKDPTESKTSVVLVTPSTATTPAMLSSVAPSPSSQGPSLSPALRDKSDAELKQDWRKSDSTVMSYVTIRPGALAGGRATRPVSLAESSHSGHTVVPVNKRFSALITDAEFAMLEERNSDSEEDTLPIAFTGRPSPTSSVKARNRRSASLNFGPGHLSKAFEAPALSGSVSAMPRLSRTLTDTHILRDTPSPALASAPHAVAGTKQWTVTTPAQSANKHSGGSPFAAWTTTPTSDRTAPVQPTNRRPTAPNQTRQPKVSISGGGGFAPVAFGLGRRAAEKVQRVWEGLSSSATSTHSASSSSIADSNRAASRQSIYGLQSSAIPGAWKHQRRTPGGPSGSWSISSSIASAESDSFSAPAGPTLGPCLRGPKRNGVGTAVIGGMVFGRDLRTCVRETAIEQVRVQLESSDGVEAKVGDIKPVEQRVLPAIVVRCYQHLMRWGLQEEGLFRINGRASHVAKLRSEFDTGADYELVKSDPGDLDPHAVSSIFKAYLRELPESILTGALVTLFEAALPKDGAAAQQPAAAPRTGLALRKPPSLSTLAMPSFAVQRTVSNETVRAIASLIAQLPIEHRDLLYTVVELINATAAASKETKMPLGNLLLLFCPSLGVSHALLRVLCEANDIWTPPVQDNIQTPALPEASEAPKPSFTSSSVANYDSSSSFSTTDSESDVSSLPAARPRGGKRRGPVATMLDVPGLSMYRSSSGSGQDDSASYMSALDGSPSDSNNSSTNLPALTTSTDSIATPSTMSEVSSLQQSSPCPVSDVQKDVSTTPEEPMVDLTLPEPRRRPLISAPVPFPSSGEGSPRTPLSPRKSLTLLSFPPLGKSDPTSSPGSATWAHRPKRPSLTLLFSKKSMSSLTPSSPSQPRKDSCNTPSDPVPIRPTTPAEPPVLDTQISSSPLHVYDFDSKQPSAGQPSSSTGDLLAAKDSDWQGRERNDSSSGSSLFSTPQQTPIADYFRGRSKSFISLLDDKDSKCPADSTKVYPARPSPMASASQVSLTPSLDIGIESTVEDDWAQSVINEAQATTSSSRSRWSVSKLF